MSEPCPYASWGGMKLDAALQAFGLSVAGWTCADFGSHAGGFVDCLLQHGAARVHAVEPGYGVLDYRLRHDPRVIVHERTNALQFVCPEPCDLITIDVGWTPQRLVLPAARRSLKPAGCVVSLVKPQYEAPPQWLRQGELQVEHRGEVCERCRQDVAELGWEVLGRIESPRREQEANAEYLWWLRLTGR